MNKLLYLILVMVMMSCASTSKKTAVNMNVPDTVFYAEAVGEEIVPEEVYAEASRETYNHEIEEMGDIESVPGPIESMPSPVTSSGITVAEPEDMTPISLSIELEDAFQGDINYVMADTMIVDKTSVVNVTISENVDLGVIVEEVESFTEENVHTESIRIAQNMRVHLGDPSGENFRIIPSTPEEQILENDEFTRWEWDVTPLKPGDNKLKLTVDILYENSSKNIEVFEDFIYVYSDKTVWDKFTDFMGNNWQWFLSTLVIPLGLWLYKRRKK